MPAAVVVALVAAGLLVSVPGGMDSPFGGTPLGTYGRIAWSVVLCTGALVAFFPLRRPPGWWLPGVLAALVSVKLALALVTVPHGWRVEYEFGDATGRMHTGRFFWRFRSHDYRVEPTIRITDDYSNLHFFNDVSLFGYPPYVQTRRDIRFPLRVTWTGYVDVPAPIRVLAGAAGAGKISVETESDRYVWEDGGQPHVLHLPRGSRRVVFIYQKPPDVLPILAAGLRDAETGAPVVTTPNPPSEWRWGGTRVTSALVMEGLLLLVVAFVGSYARSGSTVSSAEWPLRATGLAATIVLVGWGTALAVNMVWRTEDFGPGGDPLVYSSYARDILHDGPLMLQGQPIGQATPFYFYPLYPYLLAAAHALVGEDVSTILLLNGWLLALLPPLFLTLGWKELRPAAGVVAFLALLAFTYFYTRFFVTFPEPAFTDFPFMPMVFLVLIALSRALTAPSLPRLFVAGVMMALGAATRPSLMTLFYLTPVGLWFAMRQPSAMRWIGGSAAVAAGVFTGLLPFTLRNLVASDQFVMLVNSWIQIPYFLIPPELPDRPGGIPSLGQALMMAKDIFMDHPMRTIVVEVRKVLYTLGITDVGPAGFESARLFAVLTVLFTWAVASGRLRRPLAITLVTFAVSHLVAMVVAAPWTFHYKSILPLHAAFLFAAAFLLDGRRPAGLRRVVKESARETASDEPPGVSNGHASASANG